MEANQFLLLAVEEKQVEALQDTEKGNEEVLHKQIKYLANASEHDWHNSNYQITFPKTKHMYKKKWQ